MKKTVGICLFFILCLCGGCQTENVQKDDGIIEILTATPKPEEAKETEWWDSANEQNPQAAKEEFLNNRKNMKEKLEVLEKVELLELGMYADKETSLINSNVLCNLGYLAYGQEEIICFADKNIGGIFVSDRTGKNRSQLTQESGQNLQIVGEWLYYQNADKMGIKRIHLDTRQMEVLQEQPCEAFVVWKDKLYINEKDGFYMAEPDGSNKLLLQEQSLSIKDLQIAGDGIWLGNVYLEAEYTLFYEGNLLCYDMDENDWRLVQDGVQNALLAGKWLCFTAGRSGRFVVSDLQTGENEEMKYSEREAVSDGTWIYSSIDSGGLLKFYRFDGKENEELFRMESDLLVQKQYLTPDMLYWMSSNAAEEQRFYELWYYDLETGEIGKVY